MDNLEVGLLKPMPEADDNDSKDFINKEDAVPVETKPSFVTRLFGNPWSQCNDEEAPAPAATTTEAKLEPETETEPKKEEEPKPFGYSIKMVNDLCVVDHIDGIDSFPLKHFSSIQTYLNIYGTIEHKKFWKVFVGLNVGNNVILYVASRDEAKNLADEILELWKQL